MKKATGPTLPWYVYLKKSNNECILWSLKGWIYFSEIFELLSKSIVCVITEFWVGHFFSLCGETLTLSLHFCVNLIVR